MYFVLNQVSTCNVPNYIKITIYISYFTKDLYFVMIHINVKLNFTHMYSRNTDYPFFFGRSGRQLGHLDD